VKYAINTYFHPSTRVYTSCHRHLQLKNPLWLCMTHCTQQYNCKQHHTITNIIYFSMKYVINIYNFILWLNYIHNCHQHLQLKNPFGCVRHITHNNNCKHHTITNIIYFCMKYVINIFNFILWLDYIHIVIVMCLMWLYY